MIHTADPDKTGIDMYLGIGGAPEGVLAAAALRCIGGQMQCRLILDTEEKRERAHKMGVTDPKKIYGIEDMVEGRLPVCRDRGHHRLSAVGREIPQGRDRDRNRRDALGHRHRALHQGRAPPARQVSSRLGIAIRHSGMVRRTRPQMRNCASEEFMCKIPGSRFACPGMTTSKQNNNKKGERPCLIFRR